MNIIEAIEARYSVRNYDGLELTPTDIDIINNLLSNPFKGPFGNNARFILVEKPVVKLNEKLRLGTYGFITNAQYFIAGAIEKFEYSETDYGYILEKIILELTAKDFGTCWLGGTFNRKDYKTLLRTNEKEIIPAVTPVGYAANKKTIRERLGLKFTDGSTRYLFETLFFEDYCNNPLKYDEKDPYMIALEMVRMAPSAVNKQPWRVIKQNNKYHFFINRSFLNFSKKVDLQKIDLGIALCHFHLTLQHFNKKGKWHIKNPDICTLEYIITWIAE